MYSSDYQYFNYYFMIKFHLNTGIRPEFDALLVPKIILKYFDSKRIFFGKIALLKRWYAFESYVK